MIIVSGCSWSCSEFWSPLHPEMDCSWPKWFDHIETDEEVLCVGRSGYGNDRIIDLAIEQVLNNPKVTNVILALSDWTRFLVLDQTIHLDLHWRAKELAEKENRTDDEELFHEKMQGHVRDNSKIVNVHKLDPWHFMHLIVDGIILKLKTIQELCKAKGIKLTVFQMIMPMRRQYFAKPVLNAVIKNKIFQEMYTAKDVQFLNFPFFIELDGTSVEDDMMVRDDYRSMLISEYDYHPNAKGNKFIGDWFNQQVRSLS